MEHAERRIRELHDRIRELEEAEAERDDLLVEHAGLRAHIGWMEERMRGLEDELAAARKEASP